MDNFFIQLIEILTISSYVLLIVGPLLICVAFLTYLERKVIAAIPVSYTHLRAHETLR